VVRALEVALTTGVPFTAQRTKNAPLFETLTLGLNPAQEVLRNRIDRRIDEMMENKFIDEVNMLVVRYGADASAFNAIGYRELIEYLNGKLTMEDSIAAIKMNTWHYAKRQLTWFKKTPEIRWTESSDEALSFITTLLK